MAPRTAATPRAPNRSALKVAGEFGVPGNVAEVLVGQFGAKQTRELLGDLTARSSPAAAQRARPAPQPHEAPVAPWPMVDRYQQVLGSSLTLETISSLARSCAFGYRTWFVDVLEELLNRDLHAHGVLQQRVLAVAGARVEFEPPRLRPGDRREKLAQEVCDFAEAAYMAIPNRVSATVDRMWKLYYGVAGQEVQWDASEGQTWPTYLHHLHSRRLNYPSWEDWDVRVWDQGAVAGGLSGAWGRAPTNTPYFGTRARDWPGKFVVSTPRLRGAYPTRDGLGLELCWWLAIKGMAARSASIFIDRFAKPWPILQYKTAQKDGEHREADDDDIAVAFATCKAMGMGTAGSAVLPDSIMVNMYGPGVQGSGRANLTYTDFFDFCNAEMSKGVLGQTLTTEAGKRGNMGASGVHKEGSQQVARYDAAVDAEDVKRDLVSWIVRLNYPRDADLVPHVSYVVDEDPSPDQVADVLLKAVQANVGPIDARRMCEKLGLPLMSRDDLMVHLRHEQEKRRRRAERGAAAQERAAQGLPPDVGTGIDDEPDLPDAPQRCAWVKQVELSSVDETVEPPAMTPAPFGGGGAPQVGDTQGSEPNAPRGASTAPQGQPPAPAGPKVKKKKAAALPTT